MSKKLQFVALGAAFFGSTFFVSNPSFSASSCTPGIPCTTYTLESVPDAGTNASYNGKKTGVKSPYDSGYCDGNYMNQMIGEAYMHAMREIATNEQLIRKPDSILEYTCFDQFASVAARQAPKIFSGTTYYNGKTAHLETGDETSTFTYHTVVNADGSITDPNSDVTIPNLPTQMNFLIMDTLKNYIDSNFSHKYLGGSSGMTSSMVYSIGGGAYNCSQMKAVWDLSRCTNFGEDDMFLSFGQLTSGDPRQLVAACSAAPVPDVGAGAPSGSMPYGDTIKMYLDGLDLAGVMTMTETDPCPAGAETPGLLTKAQIKLSNNCDETFSAVDLAKAYFEYYRNPEFGADYPVSLAQSYAAFPYQVWGDANLCGPPIPTGMKMPSYYIVQTPDLLFESMSVATNALDPFMGMLGSGFELDEYVCPNPSCVYLIETGICAPMYVP